MSGAQRVLSLEELSALRPTLNNVVLAGGVFDILHIGHIKQLRAAKRQGDHLLVHVTGDKRVVEKKGPTRPVFSERLRAELISALHFVDYVFVADTWHYNREVLEKLRPDVLYFHSDDFAKHMHEYLEEVQKEARMVFKIVTSKRPKDESTTQIIERIKEQH